MPNPKVDEAIDRLGDHIAGLVLNNDLHDVDGIDLIAKTALAAFALVAIKLTELHAEHEAKKDETA